MRSDLEDGRLNLVVCDDEHEYVTATAIKRHVERPALDELTAEGDIFDKDENVLDKNDIYRIFNDHGLDYGGYFRVIEKAIVTEQGAVAYINCDHFEDGGRLDEVAILDGIFQAVVLLHTRQSNYDATCQFVPFYLRSLICGDIGKASKYIVHVFKHGGDVVSPQFSMILRSETGDFISEFSCFQKKEYGRLGDKLTEGQKLIFLYSTDWRANPLTMQADKVRSLTIISNASSLLYSVLEEKIEKINYIEKYNVSDEKAFNVITEILGDDGDEHNIVIVDDRLTGASASSDKGDYQTVLGLIRHILKNKVTKSVQVYYAYLHDVNSVQKAHSILAGFARTLRLENPHVQAEIVGFDSDTPINWQKNLYEEIQSYHYAPLCEVAWQGNARYDKVVRRCKQGDLPVANVEPQILGLLKHGGVYLITGGAGGIGSVFAEYLATNCCATIHVLGRSGFGAAQDRLVEIVEKNGGKCHYRSCDVSNRQEVEAFFKEIKERGVALNGIIHCAGLIEDAFIMNKSTDSFERVLAPKVDGVINLDRASLEHRLDFFVTFSSIASYMPNHGQCDYAGANSFLDAYAKYRNLLVDASKRFGRTISINWPLWESGGISVTAEEESYLREVFGMSPITRDAALSVFEYALRIDSIDNVSHVIAIDGEKNKIDRCLRVDEHSEIAGSSPYDGDTFIASWLTNELLKYVKGSSGRDVVIDDNANLGMQGLDSLGVVFLAERIHARFGVDIGPTTLFELNTITKLVDYIRNGQPKDVARRESRYNRWNALFEPPSSDPFRGRFKKTLSRREYFMRDHVVEGEYNVPGACYIEMALEAFACAEQWDPAAKGIRISNNYWAKQLSTKGGELVAELKLISGGEKTEYIITSTTNGIEETYAVGELGLVELNPAFDTIQLGNEENLVLRERDEIYRYIRGEGLDVGETLMPMESIILNEQEAISKLILPDSIRHTISDYILHPTLFTGILQTALLNNKPAGMDEDKYIPIGVDEIYVYQELPPSCVIHSVKRRLGNEDRIRKYDAKVYDVDGKLFVALEGITLRCISNSAREEIQVSHSKDTYLMKISQLDEVMEYFGRLLAETTGLRRDEIENDTGFEKYGIDSVMIIGINRKLDRIFGNISKTLLFEYQTIRELSSYFYHNHLPALIKNGIASEANPNEGASISLRKNLRERHVNTGGGSAIGVTSSLTSIRNGTQSISTAPVQSHLARTPYERNELSHLRKGASGSAVDRNDIAVVGIAGIYPGASDIYEFWDNLRNAVSSITETPKSRLDIDILDETKFTDTNNCKWGGYLEGVEHFDPAFFNISPREASNIDPQARIFLQVAWNTVENAGYDPNKLRGSSIGVYVGALWQPYTCLGVAETYMGNTQTPNGLLYNIPNRVSYFFDWCGPSIALDTACSSSLTAVHLACQGIISGEVQAALVGGVNLSYSSSKFLWLNSNHFLSSEGKCRSFGEGGDGYVPGEGAGAIFIKQLSEAVKDNDHIWGVIKSSSINHGGRTNGFTVPNPNKQRDLIMSSLRKAEVSSRDISYVEAHGTGTSLGDPIEITGLKQAFEIYTNDKQFCSIGSVKSNIGHLEAAAGIAGLTKTLLQLKHRIKVPSLYSEIENSNIEFSASPFYVQKGVSTWEGVSTNGSNMGPRTAMVSSFGAGGSNAHLIVTEHMKDNQHISADLNSNGSIRRNIFPFSARSKRSLIATIESFYRYLQTNHDESLRDVACTLQEGRSQMDERAIFVASSVEGLKKEISKFLQESNIPNDRKSNVGKERGRRQIIDKEDVHILISHWLTEGRLEKIATLWSDGYNFDWQELLGKEVFNRVPLPIYKFEKMECKMPRKTVPVESCKTAPGHFHKEARFHTTNVSNLYKTQYRINVLRGVERPGHASYNTEELESELANELGNIASQAMDCNTKLKDSPKMADLLIDNAGFIVDVFPLTADDGGFLSSVVLSITSKAGRAYKWTYVPERVGYLEASDRDVRRPDNGNVSLGEVEHDLTHLSETHVQQNFGNGTRYETREHLEKPSFIQLANINGAQRKTNQTCHEGATNDPECGRKYQGNGSVELPIDALKKFLGRLPGVNASNITGETRLCDLNVKEAELSNLITELSLRFPVSNSGEELCLRSTVSDLLRYISGRAGSTRKSHNLDCSLEISLSEVTDFLIGKLAEVLYTDVAHIDNIAPFVDLGLDSILGVEWIDIVNREYKLDMAATIIYDHPNIGALAKHIHRFLGGKGIQADGISMNSGNGLCD